ncbi:EF-hand domain-containing protein [Paraburkholderia sp. BCC1885]|uniref:EF-hand domain-containing protein n=1 Tax=Paraburkholderia sp. BCC1885 TaxID=2562669 RepID=UPI001181DF76|nr:EF-hand domain-containing protein [Paraburkholderia sp. BCC1885]
MKRFCLMLVAALAVSSVYAQDAMADKLQARFAAADIDHDGKLTLAEAQAGMPRVAAHFAQIDADHKGYVTLDDIERYAAQRRQQGQQ